MMKDLVVFDLDETLLNGDSMTLWHQFLVDKGLATAPDFLALDKQFMAAYADGSLDLDAYLAFSLSPLKHMLAEDINALAARFAKDALMPLIFPEAIVTLAQYKDEGVALAIVSASPSFLVKPVAKALGVETAMGIDLVLNNGKYQPQPEGVPSFREGKVLRLTQWIGGLDHDFERISFYTDSINDLPMCLFADDVHIINPCSKLFKKAGEYQWPVHKWGDAQSLTLSPQQPT
ncbi:phosphoserine phosphatase [Enterovibrio norvegicus]|uniref:HAD family hydrolase n=1 Tax=Enterovibrio norvegicus TaxID=188144 RepID=UPI0002DA47BD|nr:HAD family hydrolase [Enterovibrio norvegicus]MCC4798171.1 HAD-IB family hydrolase [Enterovibrio norvegicus]OEE49092.1 phosphoserine phosphatase [Enterovibrio norvegicus]OEF61563.1 phosphoserine phosphatase [Enterovibrio norvegicus]PMI37984.1 phosphoserine phosphatase [Enterovibrio norvegicus]PMN56609.1 phosphoserine phosphatase [Enterovibrio norvegicus]